MLKVVVGGSGLIPRGYGIAPRKTPFEIDLKTLKLCVYTGGLKVYAINPITGAKVLVDTKNYESIYKTYTEAKVPKAVTPKPMTKPSIPQPKTQPVKQNVQVAIPAPVKEEPIPEPQDPIPTVPDVNEESATLPVISNPNNQNNKHQKK